MSNEKDKTILELTELTSVDGVNDFIPIVDSSSNETKKVSPSNLPVSTAQQAALDLKANDADLTAHTGSTSNPHSVTAAQVGLGNVDNTSDADKPVSTAQQAALDLKANDADLTAHTGSTSNPHSVTAAQVGLGNVDNTSDADKPVSTAQQAALDLKANDADLTAHTGSTSNPHSVTAAQVGLGNVDNTSDADKPVSTAQQTALDLKADATALTTETNARIDADNRREFAGGVYCDNSSNIILPKIYLGTNNFTYKAKLKCDTSSDLFRQHHTGANRLVLYLANGTLSIIFVDASSNNTTYTISNVPMGEIIDFCLSLDRNNDANLYINGSLHDSVDISASSNVDLGLNNTDTSYLSKQDEITFYNFAIFNTALTATQAAELYQQGLQPWLAANPEYRRGYEVYQSDFSSGTDDWGGSGDEDGVTVSQSSAGIGGQSNTIIATLDSSIGVHAFWDDLDRYNGTGLFKIKFDVYIPSNQNINGVQVLVSSEGSNSFQPILNPTLDSWNTYESNTFKRTTADSNRINFYLTDDNERVFTGNGTDFAHFKNIEITQVGSLATLPLDDERSLLRDISGNGNHATASDTGVTHLKSSPVTLETVDTLVDADNRREFAGGVALDGVSGSFNVQSIAGATAIDQTPTIYYIWDAKDNGETFQRILNYGNWPSSGYAITIVNSTKSIEFDFRKDAAGGKYSVYNTASNVFNYGEILQIIVILNKNGPTLYINGSAVTLTEKTAPNGTYVEGSTHLYIGNSQNPSSNRYTKGSISNFAIFNTALTATQAAELYQQGLQPWLAANPEYRRAQDLTNILDPTVLAPDATWIYTAIDDSNYDLEAINNLGTKFLRLKNSTFNGNTKYRFTFDYTVISGTSNLALSRSNPFQNIAISEGFNSIELDLTDDSIIQFRCAAGATFEASIRNLTVTQIGSLATLPLDDDCRQLKDISGNRNDATASESGVTHLKQKDLHAFRDDHADGTGGSYLIANADILSENEVITGVTVDGRFYAASGAQDLTKRRIKLQDHGSHVDVKRSNGTTDDSAIAVTNPSDGTDFAITVLTQRI